MPTCYNTVSQKPQPSIQCSPYIPAVATSTNTESPNPSSEDSLFADLTEQLWLEKDANLKAKNADLEKENTAQKTEIDGLNAKIDELESEITTLKDGAMDAESNAMEALKAENADLEKENTAQKTEIDGLNAKIDELESEITTLNDGAMDAEYNGMDALEDKIADLKAKIEQFEARGAASSRKTASSQKRKREPTVKEPQFRAALRKITAELVPDECDRDALLGHLKDALSQAEKIEVGVTRPSGCTAFAWSTYQDCRKCIVAMQHLLEKVNDARRLQEFIEEFQTIVEKGCPEIVQDDDNPKDTREKKFQDDLSALLQAYRKCDLHDASEVTSLFLGVDHSEVVRQTTERHEEAVAKVQASWENYNKGLLSLTGFDQPAVRDDRVNPKRSKTHEEWVTLKEKLVDAVDTFARGHATLQNFKDLLADSDTIHNFPSIVSTRIKTPLSRAKKFGVNWNAKESTRDDMTWQAQETQMNEAIKEAGIVNLKDSETALYNWLFRPHEYLCETTLTNAGKSRRPTATVPCDGLEMALEVAADVPCSSQGQMMLN